MFLLHPKMEPSDHEDSALFLWLIPILPSRLISSIKPFPDSGRTSARPAHQVRTNQGPPQNHVPEPRSGPPY